MRPFHLTIETAASAAAQAYRDGRLAIQTGKTKCRYRYADGTVCAIGAALPKRVAKAADKLAEQNKHYAVFDIIEEGIVSSDDVYWLGRLQDMHDKACCFPPPESASYFHSFLRHVNKYLPEQPITADDWPGCPDAWK